MASIEMSNEQTKALYAALAQRFGLDPEQITTIRAESSDSHEEATVTWEGQATLPKAEFLAMLDGPR